MKKLLVGLLLFATTCTMNKEDNQIPIQHPPKGPHAKNMPWWKRPATPVVTRGRTAKKKWGGAFKNAGPGIEQQALSTQPLVRRKKQAQKGPQAKNRRP